jgi:hypothetical protein
VPQPGNTNSQLTEPRRPPPRRPKKPRETTNPHRRSQPLICSTCRTTTLGLIAPPRGGPCHTMLKLGGTPPPLPKEGSLQPQATAPSSNGMPEAAYMTTTTAQDSDLPPATGEDAACAPRSRPPVTRGGGGGRGLEEGDGQTERIHPRDS